MWEVTDNPKTVQGKYGGYLEHHFDIHEYTEGKGKTWDAKDNTLTLKGFEYSNGAAGSTNFSLADGSVLVLADGTENKIDAEASSIGINFPEEGNWDEYFVWEGSGYSAGIVGLGDLTIKGNGSLEVKATRGIETRGDLIIEDGDIKIASNYYYMTNATCLMVYGDFEMSGGNISARSTGQGMGYPISNMIYGVTFKGNVDFINGEIESTTSFNPSSSSGYAYPFLVYLDGHTDHVNISGGKITLKNQFVSYGDDSPTLFGEAFDIEKGDVNISGGEIYAECDRGNGIAIFSRQGEKVNITGGTITALSKEGSVVNAINLYSANQDVVNISGGRINATGGKNNSEDDGVAYGIWTNSKLNITGGEIKANSGEGFNSGAIYCDELSATGTAKVYADNAVVNNVVDAKNHTVTALEDNRYNIKPVAAKVNDIFTDVLDGKWYSNEILYVYQRGAMKGKSEGVFDPLALIQRSETIAMLYQLEGSPAVDTSKALFPDVTSKNWYNNAATWGKTNGIISGLSSGPDAGKFMPKNQITRQDFTKILYEYAKYKGYDVSVKSATSYTEVEDASLISKYARECMNWGYENKFIANGSNFKPKDNITRREAAVMLARFLEKYDYK